MIDICMDYRDLNCACPKDNYPTSFINQIIDECARSEIFSFMDSFSGYSQINITPIDQEKITFICPWGTFAYKKLPFALKNSGATFQWAMSYAFHDIRNIVQPYLDDLLAHSRQLVGFIISKDSIFLHPLKFEVIINLTPPSSLHQLQSMQEKAKFLRRFMPNYAGLAIRFTLFIKQGIPFAWDEATQKYFDDLKALLKNDPLLHPPDYY
eukprot:PITA_08532